MFKQSRRKIVISIMSILLLLWISTLGIIYASSYMEMTRRNEDMLKTHVAMYSLEEETGGKKPNKPAPEGENNPAFKNSPVFQLSTFYTVALSYDGEIMEVKNSQPSLHSEEELQKLAEDIFLGKKEKGIEKNLSFFKADKGGYILVAFMDITLINENAAMLIRYTMIFGAAALVIFFLISTKLAQKIVQPLEESYQKQKQFISDAGHELKTPVSVVGANAEILSREIGKNQWLSNIQYENERMTVLISQLLELARAENVTELMEKVDFSRLCNGEILPLESVAFEKNRSLDSHIHENIEVVGNSTQLKQLVSILVDNAIDHSCSEGTIELHLTKEHGYAKFSVINEGKEIPKGQRKELFERFYRCDEVRNGEDKHYGLGLSIAKAIVNAHKGHIGVQCYDGLVEFSVKIPLA